MTDPGHLTAPHIPGLELSRGFYDKAVRPILARAYPALPYAAALLGSGSEVLGFDDAMSRDHHWGPRLMLFLPEADHRQHAAEIRTLFSHELPPAFRGYPTHWSAPDPNDDGVQQLQPFDGGPVNHRVDLLTVREFLLDYLNYDLTTPLTTVDWLTFPMQKLRTITAGAVYHDEIGLEAIRDRFAWYPHDVWLYQLASVWERIGEEEHLMGRAGLVGDEIGSALIGGRLVRDVMRLGFLMERQYPPYPKWFGTAFRQLACAAELEPALQQALTARSWREREAGLVPAYQALAAMHNRLGLTERMPETVTDFFGRPFRVIARHGFSEALQAEIKDPAVQRLLTKRLIGSLDLFSDSTALAEDTPRREQVRNLYE